MMDRVILETIKEFNLSIDGLGFQVKGKIVKQVFPASDMPYTCDISHHFRPKDGGMVYHPGAISGKTFEEVEKRLLHLMHEFTTLDVESNKSWEASMF